MNEQLKNYFIHDTDGEAEDWYVCTTAEKMKAIQVFIERMDFYNIEIKPFDVESFEKI